jgi:hypothetical protein
LSNDSAGVTFRPRQSASAHSARHFTAVGQLESSPASWRRGLHSESGHAGPCGRDCPSAEPGCSGMMPRIRLRVPRLHHARRRLKAEANQVRAACDSAHPRNRPKSHMVRATPRCVRSTSGTAGCKSDSGASWRLRRELRTWLRGSLDCPLPSIIDHLRWRGITALRGSIGRCVGDA